MYDYGYSYGYGLIGGNTYNPLINYSWSSTYQAQEYKTDGVELVTVSSLRNNVNTSTVITNGFNLIDDGSDVGRLYFDSLEIIESEYILLRFTASVNSGSCTITRYYDGGWNTMESYTISDGDNSIVIPNSREASTGFIFLDTSTDDVYDIDISSISVQKVIQEPNKMYSKNSGTGTDLQLYSGQGVKFNGVDQELVGSEVNYNQNEALSINLTVKNSVNFVGYSQYIVVLQDSSNLRVYYFEDNTLKISIKGSFYELYRGMTLGESYRFSIIINGDTLYTYLGEDLVSTNVIPPFLLGSFVTDFASNNTYGGTLSDFFIFNRALTQTEITKYSTNPNGFFNDALVDDTCVLNMPLAEHSDYCIDYTNYSEAYRSDFSVGIDGWYGQTDGFDNLSVESGRLKVLANGGTNPRAEIQLTSEPGTTYTVFAKIGLGTSSDDFRVRVASSTFGNDYSNATVFAGEYFSITFTAGSSTTFFNIVAVTSDTTYFYIDDYIIVDSGIHQIQNYTDSCRDEAKQLPYGSQNANYKINGLGMRTDESPYFESSELFDNYGDTGWIPSITDVFTIDLVAYYDGGLVNGRHGASNNVYGNQDIDRWFYSLFGAYYSEGLGAEARYINIVVSYNGVDTVTFYRDGVLKDTQIITPMEVTLPFLMGKQNGLTSQIATQVVRLFKVHQKALTQEEVTKAYTDAVNKGLLS